MNRILVVVCASLLAFSGIAFPTAWRKTIPVQPHQLCAPSDSSHDWNILASISTEHLESFVRVYENADFLFDSFGNFSFFFDFLSDSFSISDFLTVHPNRFRDSLFRRQTLP